MSPLVSEVPSFATLTVYAPDPARAEAAGWDAHRDWVAGLLRDAAEEVRAMVREPGSGTWVSFVRDSADDVTVWAWVRPVGDGLSSPA